jgi:hypothetical protein
MRAILKDVLLCRYLIYRIVESELVAEEKTLFLRSLYWTRAAMYSRSHISLVMCAVMFMCNIS